MAVGLILLFGTLGIPATAPARSHGATMAARSTGHLATGGQVGTSFDLSAAALAKLHPWPKVQSAPKVRAGTLTAAGATTGSVYTALLPSRILDTRSTGGPLGPGGAINLTVVGGSVPSTAVAVALNVTVTDTTQASFLTLYPTGGTQPVVSNLNWVSGQTVPNLVIVPVGQGGQVTIYNHSGKTDVVVDLQGYFAPSTSGTAAGSYVPLPPVRIADTRSGSGEPYSGDTLQAGSTLTLSAAGAGDLPAAGVAAVLLNVTVTDTTQASYLSVYPQGGNPPTSSDLNWTAGETVANRVVVPVGPNGQITVYNYSGQADLVVDVSGYFTSGPNHPSNAGLFTAITPVRLLDTRVTGSPLGPGQTLSQQMAGLDGISSQATAVVTNVTAANTTQASFFTVYPGGVRPIASDVNWAAGQTVPNLTVATLGAGGSVTVYNHAGSADVIVDAFGYFVPGSSTAAPLAVTTTSLPQGAAGTPISDSLAATGGTAPYRWQIISGALPSGLTLDSNGLISGYTEQSGTATFQVQVTDSASPTPGTATAQLSMTITGPTMGVVQSPNWSGYFMGDGPYTQVSGTFSVPSLYQGQSNSYMAEWAGIDGASNSNLIQAGIVETQDPSNPSNFYIVPWWEILPSPETPITTMTVAPGDLLTITIAQQSGSSWSISLLDTTNGQSFTTVQTYTGPLSSVEWIVEAPQVNGAQSTLADYTTTSFTNLAETGPISSEVESLMVQNGQQVSTPSSLTSSGFAVAYGPNAPAPP
ncbi:MAG: G1 family glutamic endopeptidase [Candidatus Dormibacteria bacterium]